MHPTLGGTHPTSGDPPEVGCGHVGTWGHLGKWGFRGEGTIHGDPCEKFREFDLMAMLGLVWVYGDMGMVHGDMGWGLPTNGDMGTWKVWWAFGISRICWK